MPRREIGSTGTKNQILRYCRSRGGWWQATPVSPFGKSGLPDIIGCYKGYFVGIEVKHPKFKDPYSALSTDQLLTFKEIAAKGQGVILCANSLVVVEAALNVLDDPRWTGLYFQKGN